MFTRSAVYYPVGTISMKNISVVGTGVMGHGLAPVFALGGYQDTLHDVSEGAGRIHRWVLLRTHTGSESSRRTAGVGGTCSIS